MNKELINPEDIQRAKNLSGENRRVTMPFIPIITINNQKETKEIEIDGEKKTVSVPPKKGFNLIEQIDGQTVRTFFREELSAGILKIRYKIISKYKQWDPPFFSFEFDNFNSVIQIRNSLDAQQVIAEGTYREIKQKFVSSTPNQMGGAQAAYKLYAMLYLDLDNQIYRFQWRLGKYNNLFDYLKTFDVNETIVGFKTNFVLRQKKIGDIEFWYAQAERGEKLNLREQLAKQAKLQNLFAAVDLIRDEKTNLSETITVEEEKTQALPETKESKTEEEEIAEVLDQIPF